MILGDVRRGINLCVARKGDAHGIAADLDIGEGGGAGLGGEIADLNSGASGFGLDDERATGIGNAGGLLALRFFASGLGGLLGRAQFCL